MHSSSGHVGEELTGKPAKVEIREADVAETTYNQRPNPAPSSNVTHNLVFWRQIPSSQRHCQTHLGATYLPLGHDQSKARQRGPDGWNQLVTQPAPSGDPLNPGLGVGPLNANDAPCRRHALSVGLSGGYEGCSSVEHGCEAM